MEYLNTKTYMVDGWRHWCVKLDNGIACRLKYVKDRLVNTDSTDSIYHSFDTFCIRKYKTGERRTMKLLSDICRKEYTYSDIEDYLKDLNVENAKHLWSLKCLPTLHALGEVSGASQKCTMSWFDVRLEDVWFPRHLLENHPSFFKVKAISLKKPTLDDEICSYEDRILRGEHFPILEIVDTSGQFWVLKIRGIFEETYKLTIDKYILKGHHYYDDVYVKYSSLQS